MDVILAIVVVLALAAPAGLAAAWFSTNGAEALSTVFRPDRGLGWPRGVQEGEPTAWTWDRAAAPPAPDLPAERAQRPVVAPVAFRVGPGSARDRRSWR